MKKKVGPSTRLSSSPESLFRKSEGEKLSSILLSIATQHLSVQRKMRAEDSDIVPSSYLAIKFDRAQGAMLYKAPGPRDMGKQ